LIRTPYKTLSQSTLNIVAGATAISRILTVILSYQRTRKKQDITKNLKTMDTMEKTKITVETTVKAGVDKAWEHFTDPKSITNWCAASDDWHAPRAENDLKVGGKFVTTMAAKDGSMSFDFGGVYSKVDQNKTIEYTMDDGRTVQISFSGQGNETKVTETFEAEGTNPIEMQRGGWQAILDNYKKYTEAN
jgi:uncharacterized protein YndB with AHSA1/START domain